MSEIPDMAHTSDTSETSDARGMATMPELDSLLFSLSENLERVAELLAQLRSGLAKNRLCFVALRPSELEGGVGALEDLAGELARLAAARQEILGELCDRRGIEDKPTLSRILEGLPEGARRRLERAGQRARQAAFDLGAEASLGGKLLEFSRASIDSLMVSLVRLGDPDHHCYDARARSIRVASSGGTLIRGDA